MAFLGKNKLKNGFSTQKTSPLHRLLGSLDDLERFLWRFWVKIS
jgi:hypothetical protein